ncbi:RNA exonuclease [Paraphaeosphaeria sporulosa]
MPLKYHSIRVAVALGCEMGTASSGDLELIRVTLIDYFSEEILIDNLVEPDVPMQHLNTRFSGGKAGARQAIWRYVGTDKSVVGHGVSNDMRALRWIYVLVVDSFVAKLSRTKIKEAEAGDKETAVQENSLGKDTVDVSAKDETQETVHVQRPGCQSLKALAKKHLGRDIQTNGRRCHDSLEDAVAARDVVHWNVPYLNKNLQT